MLKRSLLFLFILFVFVVGCKEQGNIIYVASYNVENLFDTIDAPDKNDEEFLPEGAKQWTDEKLKTKMKNLAKVINYMNDGKGPDLIGIEEVEHEHLLRKLIEEYLENKSLKIVYAESPDNRGIDCGIIYNSEKLKLIDKSTYEVTLKDKYPTRLILHAEFEDSFGGKYHFYVNHWSSRRGGKKASEPNRIAAAEVLRASVEKIYRKDSTALIIITGDFNDEPDNKSIKEILKANPYIDEKVDTSLLYNLSYRFFKKRKGTYKYKNNWNMLDQFIVSKNLLNKNSTHYLENSFEVIKPDFIIQKKGKYKGSSLPTYGGKKYLKGYSDHFPVGIKIVLKDKNN